MTTVPRGSTATAIELALGVLAGALLAVAAWAAVDRHGDLALGLGIGGLEAAGVALLVAQLSRPPRIDVSVTDRRLVVRFRAWDMLWTLHRQVQLDPHQVVGVTVRPVGTSGSGWRWRRGTFLPGLIKAGSFGPRGSRELWDVRPDADAVDIDLAAPAPFRRLVLQLPDPSAAADQVRAAARVRSR